MSDALSSAELNGCQVELLPARTVLSLFVQASGGGNTNSKGGGLFDILKGDFLKGLGLKGLIPGS